MASRKKGHNKGKVVALCLIGMLIIVSVVLLASYSSFERTNKSSNNQNGIEIDENAIKDEDDNEEKMKPSEGGGAASLSFSDKVSIDNEEGISEIYIKNPSKSIKSISVTLSPSDSSRDKQVAE